MHRTRLGLQIPNFTYPGVAPAQLFERVAAQAVTAEESGFDTVFVMDHFFQLPLLGTPDQEMFEAYTLLGASGRPDVAGPAGHAGDRRDLPRARPPGQGRDRPRRHLRRSGPPRHRRGVVRAGARRARLRVPAAEGALRAPRRCPRDLPRHVHPDLDDLRRARTTA